MVIKIEINLYAIKYHQSLDQSLLMPKKIQSPTVQINLSLFNT
jgi:hypothetical protein